MIGLIFKVLSFFGLLIVGCLVALNAFGIVKPGTISAIQPDPAPCRRVVNVMQPPQHPVYVEVRWVWEAKAYGWGCFWENEDATTHTLAPMPR